MRLFDPARPQSDGIMLGQWDATAHGRSGTFPLPVLYVEPGAADGQWLVTVHMPTSGHSFAGFQAKIGSQAELIGLFNNWCEDPERTLLDVFHYDPSVVQRKEAGRKIIRERTVASGLAALGLDD